MIDVGLAPNAGCIQVSWPEVCCMLEEHGQSYLEVVDPRDVYVQLLERKLDLWLATDGPELIGVAICSWERHAKRSFYHINFMCGKGLSKFLAEGLKKIEQFACFSGAAEVVLGGRWGWERTLRAQGYAQKFIELRKDVKVCWN